MDRSLDSRARRGVVGAAAIALGMASGAAQAQEMQGADMVRRLEGPRVIGEASVEAYQNKLQADGTLRLPTPVSVLEIPITIDGEESGARANFEAGVAFTGVNWGKKNIDQFNVLGGIGMTEGGDTETWMRVGYAGIRGDRFAGNVSVERNFTQDTTTVEAGLLGRLGTYTAAGIQAERQLGNEGNTNVDLVLRHDFRLPWNTMGRGELAVGEKLEGGLAYNQPGTRNEGGSRIGARFTITPQDKYAGVLLGGAPGIEGGWSIRIEGGHEETEVTAPIPVPGVGAVPTALDAEANFVRAKVAIRF